MNLTLLSSAMNALKIIGSACALTVALAACTEPETNQAQPSGTAPAATMAPMFDDTLTSLQAALDERRAAGVPVPQPVDAGGGYTHEQHKQNGKTIYEAGMLYELTGDDTYRDFAAEVLLEYADLYPTLDLHPKRKENHPAGRVFWQGLNEAMWLVYASQGYGAIKADLTDEQQEKIESQLMRPMADFLSEGSPRTFNRIHNHGTWAAAAVGLTGYVIGERDYVDKALYGLDKSGDAGFLKQMDELFSPDGYYAEGPYYQRFALMPFILFAQSIERNDPDLKIFDRRDGLLRKAITSTIQQSYGGRFYPINDAIREKGLNTVELRYAVAIAYDLTQDPTLLSVAQMQKGVVPTPQGRALAQAIADGKTEPFVFKTLQLRDGPKGDRGALITLRSGPEPDAAAVVFKATSQGLGHGHFDRLGLLYFDNGDEIVADYGASRFLNVEPKNGGHYLAENLSWAKQTVAHNTLVVDEQSQFDGDWRIGEERVPTIVGFDDTPGASFAAAEIDTAYDGVALQRLIAMVDRPGGGQYVIDVMRARSDETHNYDLPVHFKGQLIETNIDFNHNTAELRPLGQDNGYQHLWKTASSPTADANTLSDMSILIDDQFYTFTFATNSPTAANLARLGANDPDNNLRNEQALLLRTQAESVDFVSIYERHGRYDNDEEITVYEGGSIANIEISELDGIDVYSIKPKTGATIQLLYANGGDGDTEHKLFLGDETIRWTGPVTVNRTQAE